MPDARSLGAAPLRSLRSKIGGYHPILQWYRTNRPTWWWSRAHRLGRVSTRYISENGLKVARGAFIGLEYPPDALGKVGFITSKLLGAYEPLVVAELDRLASDHDTFVDIGSAEGYFCVGLARRHPHLRVIGYELTARERALSQLTARLNGVQFEVREKADISSFGDLGDERTMILVDVEGYEYTLLDPDAAPDLRRMTIVVELHDPDSPGIAEVLRSRFSASHEIEVLQASADDQSQFDELAGWSPTDAEYAMSDGRGYLGEWMVLRPRSA